MELTADRVTVSWCDDYGVTIDAIIGGESFDLDWWDDTAMPDTDRVVSAINYVRYQWAPDRGMVADIQPREVDAAQRRDVEHGAGHGNKSNWVTMPLERAVSEEEPEQQALDDEDAPKHDIEPHQ